MSFMQNGQTTNGIAGAHVVQVNPIQAAQFALMFLARADMKAAEREAYALAEGLLQAIIAGSVVLAPPAPKPEAAAVAPAGDTP